MTTLATDNFTRANQSGFGTASDGTNVWGSPVNGSATAAITSNRGIFGNFNNDTQMICGSHSGTTDINMLVKVSTSNVNNVAGILWRYSSASGGNGYRCGFFSGNQFVVDKYTNGSRSNLVDNSITSYSANTDMWIRLIHTAGGTLQIRWWLDGNSEPSNFSSPFVNQSETAFSSGNFGVSVAIFSGNTVSYGSFTVTDNQTSVHSSQKYTGRFYQIAGTSKKFTSRFSQMAGATKKFTARLYQMVGVSKKFTSRFSQMTGASKKFTGRLFQTVLAQRKFSTRFSQLAASQRKYASRFFHETNVGKAFVARLSQYDRIAKRWASRLTHTALAQRIFRSRLYQLTGTSKQFASRFGHESLNGATQVFAARFRQMTGASKQYSTRLAQSVLSQRVFRSRLYQMIGTSKRYTFRFNQSAHVARLFKARFGHIGDVDIILAQQIYSWRFGHVARASKPYACRFGHVVLPYAVGSGRDGNATGTGRDGYVVGSGRDGAITIGKGA